MGLTRFLASSLAVSTKKSYLRTWQRYVNFCEMRQVLVSFPISVEDLALFVTRLAFEGLKANTIKSHLSALSYLHKFYEVKNPVESSAYQGD